MQPDEKQKLSNYYKTAHAVAKTFCDNHSDADPSEIYKNAETAARLYHDSPTIQAAKSAKDFITYKIQSAYERNMKRMTHDEKFKPISEEIKAKVIADAELGLTNTELTKKYHVSSSSVTRILQKAGIIPAPVPKNKSENIKPANKPKYSKTKPVPSKSKIDMTPEPELYPNTDMFSEQNKKTEIPIKSEPAELYTESDPNMNMFSEQNKKTEIPIKSEPNGSKKDFFSIPNRTNFNKKTNEKPNELETMFKNSQETTNDADDLSHIISHLGLMLSDKLTSISMQYNLNGKNIKIKIEKLEK